MATTAEWFINSGRWQSFTSSCTLHNAVSSVKVSKILWHFCYFKLFFPPFPAISCKNLVECCFSLTPTVWTISLTMSGLDPCKQKNQQKTKMSLKPNTRRKMNWFWLCLFPNNQCVSSTFISAGDVSRMSFCQMIFCLSLRICSSNVFDVDITTDFSSHR